MAFQAESASGEALSGQTFTRGPVHEVAGRAEGTLAANRMAGHAVSLAFPARIVTVAAVAEAGGRGFSEQVRGGGPVNTVAGATAG